MDEVKREAKRRHVELVIQPTAYAIETHEANPKGANAILNFTW